MEHRLIIGDTADGKRRLVSALLRNLCSRRRQLGHLMIIPPSFGLDIDDDIPDTPLEEFERRLDELLE